MGYGDWIIATAQVRQANEKTGLKVKLGDGTRWYFDQDVHQYNPRMCADKDEPRAVWVDNYPGRRPYITEVTKDRIVFNDSFRVSPGELYFREKEFDWIKQLDLPSDYIIVEPNVKACYAHTVNKSWTDIGWNKVFKEDLPFIQLGRDIEPKVRHIKTKTFRSALTILKGAKLFVGTDGGLHHAAAALGIPAVVIWTGFSSPRHLGYDSHLNLHDGSEPCGTHNRKCPHCRKKSELITPDVVISAIRRELEKR